MDIYVMLEKQVQFSDIIVYPVRNKVVSKWIHTVSKEKEATVIFDIIAACRHTKSQ